MAKHKHREQGPVINDTNVNNATNNRNIPFGIDPMQLMGLLGGNLDMNNIGNMLTSMNTNGFNLGSLNSIAQMMGLNLDNNLFQGNMGNANSDTNKNMYSNMNHNMNHNTNHNMNKGTNSSEVENNSRKVEKNAKNVKENDVNLEFLMALRSYAHPDRINFIDKIIEAYKCGEIKEN